MEASGCLVTSRGRVLSHVGMSTSFSYVGLSGCFAQSSFVAIGTVVTGTDHTILLDPASIILHTIQFLLTKGRDR